MRWRRRRGGDELAPEPPVPDDTPSDPMRVFLALAEHGVQYAAIGGIAVQAHGHVRTTRDVDLLVAPDPENLERLADALVALQARLMGVDAHLLGIDPTDADDLRKGASFALMTLAGPIDLWTDPAELKGATAWAEIHGRLLEVSVSGVTIRIVGRDDLISMKRAAGRPRDLADIEALTALPEPGSPEGAPG